MAAEDDVKPMRFFEEIAVGKIPCADPITLTHDAIIAIADFGGGVPRPCQGLVDTWCTSYLANSSRLFSFEARLLPPAADDCTSLQA